MATTMEIMDILLKKMEVIKKGVEETLRKNNSESILSEVFTRANTPDERFMAMRFYEIMGVIDEYLAKVDYLLKPIRITGELNLEDSDPLSINGYKLNKGDTIEVLIGERWELGTLDIDSFMGETIYMLVTPQNHILRLNGTDLKVRIR